MKILKKLMSTVLASTMVVGMSIGAFATEKEYAFEVPDNVGVEEQWPDDLVHICGANITGEYHLVRACGKDTESYKFKMNNRFDAPHNVFNVKVDPSYGTCCVKITGDNGYESETFNVSSTKSKTIKVSNAKPDVKYKATLIIGDGCNEAGGDFAITSYIQ